MLGISLVVKESVGIIHEGKDFGDYGYVRGYNSGGMWGGLFSQPPIRFVAKMVKTAALLMTKVTRVRRLFFKRYFAITQR